MCLPTSPSYYGMHNKISKGHFERCSGSLRQYVGFSVQLLALSMSSRSIHAVASVGHIAFYRTERPPFIHVSLHRWTSGVFPPPGHWAHAAGATGERAPETCSQFLGVRAYPGAALQGQVEFVSDFLRTVPRFRSHSPGLSDSFPPGDGCPHFLSPCPILVLEYSDCTSKATC